MTRYYIVDVEGKIYGEADTESIADLLMRNRFTEEEMAEKEIEIVEGN